MLVSGTLVELDMLMVIRKANLLWRTMGQCVEGKVTEGKKMARVKSFDSKPRDVCLLNQIRKLRMIFEAVLVDIRYPDSSPPVLEPSCWFLHHRLLQTSSITLLS